VFYALNDTVTPVVNSVITIALNILLVIILTPPLGMIGLASATSVSGIFSGIQILFRLRRKIGNVHGWEIAGSSLKIFLASIAMGLIMTLSYPFIQSLNLGIGFIAHLVRVIISSSMGVPFYLLVLFLLKSQEISIITTIVKQQIPKVLRKSG
jgi:putative peptidoglycan lipid II flippase